MSIKNAQIKLESLCLAKHLVKVAVEAIVNPLVNPLPRICYKGRPLLCSHRLIFTEANVTKKTKIRLADYVNIIRRV